MLGVFGAVVLVLPPPASEEVPAQVLGLGVPAVGPVPVVFVADSFGLLSPVVPALAVPAPVVPAFEVPALVVPGFVAPAFVPAALAPVAHAAGSDPEVVAPEVLVSLLAEGKPGTLA